MPKVYVLMEHDNPVGVTKSKTKAEHWLFSGENDYLTFDMDDTIGPEDKAPSAPSEERNNTNQQRIMRNVDTLDRGLDVADKELKKTVENLQKRFSPKSSLLRRVNPRSPNANDPGTKDH